MAFPSTARNAGPQFTSAASAMTRPSEKRSAAGPTALPNACSGAMYPSLPLGDPGSVTSEFPAARATPATPTHSSRLEQKPLFAAVPPPSRLKLKLAVGAGVLVLAAGLFFAAPRGRRLLLSAVSGAPAAAHGQLRVTCRPEEAEVYVDGSLRGTTPLTVELPAGKHSVRVGSPRLEHWRAAEVLIKDGVEHHLDIDLSE